MREKTYHIYLNEEERSRVIQSLIELKNNLAAQGRYTDAVDDVLCKVLGAKKKKLKIEYIKTVICRLFLNRSRRLFLFQKNFFEKFSEKWRFWVCISYPFVQMSEGVHSG